jgi:hypothetical protein
LRRISDVVVVVHDAAVVDAELFWH